MILQNSRPVFGGTDRSGLNIPGALQFGKQVSEPEIIDLTTPVIDPRLSYTGPAHYYWNSHGELALCAENEWLVNYRDNVAQGRHEPEPATTNLQPECRATVLGKFIKTSGIDALQVSATGAPDGGEIALVPVECDVYTLSQDIGGAYIWPYTAHSISDAWDRIVFTVTSTAYSALRIWMGRNSVSGAPAIWGTQGYLPAGTYTASFYVRSNDGRTFRAGLAQLEKSDLATSPVITGDTTATRSASSVVIDTTDVSSVTVIYSSGETDDYTTPGETYRLPFAQRNWGERYINRIVMRK